MHVIILGCGQLARLLAEAGQRINLNFTFVAIEDEPVDCVKNLGQIVHWRKGMPAETLLQATGIPDVVTVERESIDTKLLYELSLLCRVSPSPEIVATCQHRLKEKMGMSKLEIPMTPWFPVSDNKSLLNAVRVYGFPLVIKSFENGYDGKNQWHIDSAQELSRLVKKVAPKDWIVEPKINFITEASLIAGRSINGEIKFYPITENHHESGILKRSIAPLENIAAADVRKTKKSLKTLMEAWQYVGVITMELFLTKEGFMVNELAPRVHNSGHWTKNGDVTCQFENHLRAILGKPLGHTESPYYNGMINLLGRGTDLPKINLPDGEVCLYGKLPRAGRKLGHINMFDSDRTNLIKRMSSTEQLLGLSKNVSY